ncbi:MAG: hypothetical protein O7I42_02910 [Alphaproteobacteria bacterium]|nr:hypothetical protein [Alphaproteobacteria bacterium]
MKARVYLILPQIRQNRKCHEISNPVADLQLTAFPVAPENSVRRRNQPTFPRWHSNPWKSYHHLITKGTVSPLQPSDGQILEIGPRFEGHSVTFPAIQTHFARYFHCAVDFPCLRRNGSWSQINNQAQDFPEQFPRHRHLGQLERDVPAMADDVGGGDKLCQ